MKKGRYLLSVDGGGTKTEFCIYDIETEEMKSFVFGGMNYKNLGLKEVEVNLKQSLYEIYDYLDIGPDDIRGTVLGVSGCDTEEDYRIYESMIERVGMDMEKVFLCNDSEMVFLSAAEKPGICVVSGTGSIAVGFDKEGKSSRCGGWGRPLSDLGSGYWIGEQMLKKWIKYNDGQISFDSIFKELADFFHMEKAVCPCYDIAVLNQRQIVASARLISDRADEGNALCREVISEAAEEVADIASAVYGKLKLDKEEKMELVMIGSIFNSSFYRKVFQEQFLNKTKHERILYMTLKGSPAQAGISLVKNKFL